MVMGKLIKEKIESFLADFEDRSLIIENLQANGLKGSNQEVVNILLMDAYNIINEILEENTEENI